MEDQNARPMTLGELQKECIEFVDTCADLNVFVRSVDLQRSKIGEIDIQVNRVKGYKLSAIDSGHEIAANELFHLQCVLRSIQASLSVWVEVKSGNLCEAWNRLVDAQEYKDVALLTRDYEGLRNLEVRLDRMREVLFPHFNLYNSPGWVETIGNCSICGALFSTCDHIENRVYMGRLCRRVNRRVVEYLHAALVENPRDRRCIITKRSEGDRMIDTLTYEDAGPRNNEGDGMLVEGVMFTLARLDLD